MAISQEDRSGAICTGPVFSAFGLLLEGGEWAFSVCSRLVCTLAVDCKRSPVLEFVLAAFLQSLFLFTVVILFYSEQ